MILSDREIQLAIGSGQLALDPCPSPLLEHTSSTSIDLTLAKEAKVWKTGIGLPIRPGYKEYSYEKLIKFQQDISISDYPLEPYAFILAWTEQRLSLPVTSRLAARVEGRSSLARLGLGVHATAPTIHAGFDGRIQLEMFNVGPNTIYLDAGIKVCQLIFELVFGTPVKGYMGSFLGQEPG